MISDTKFFELNNFLSYRINKRPIVFISFARLIEAIYNNPTKNNKRPSY